MPKITYLEPEGVAHAHDIPVGMSLMRGAIVNDVPGILAECGGAAACGTCRIIVDAAWRDRVPAPGVAEHSIIADYEEPYRLSCQIPMTAELDGIVVTVAVEQF